MVTKKSLWKLAKTDIFDILDPHHAMSSRRRELNATALSGAVGGVIMSGALIIGAQGSDNASQPESPPNKPLLTVRNSPAGENLATAEDRLDAAIAVDKGGKDLPELKAAKNDLDRARSYYQYQLNQQERSVDDHNIPIEYQTPWQDHWAATKAADKTLKRG